MNDVSQAWDSSLNVASDEEMLVSHHTVRNCTIAYGGRLHPAAVGVWIGHSPYNIIEHNDVHNFYYTGFSVGWSWGYGASRAHHNDIGFNHVYDIGQGVLSDMGGIYTLGISPGTVIHDNRFHDVISYDYGGWGLYTDEGSTGIVMKNNLVYRCSRGCFHQHYGKENRVENNILAYAGRASTAAHADRRAHFVLLRTEHRLLGQRQPAVGQQLEDDNFRMDYNLYFHAGQRPIKFPGDLTWEQWQKDRGQDQHSLIADPLFENPKQGDFRLKPDSPALKLGFVPFDYTQAGGFTCRVDARLAARPSRFSLTAFAAPRRSIRHAERTTDSSGDPGSARPCGARLEGADRRRELSVSDETGPRARLVNLNLSPGLVDCVQVLQALVSAMPVEDAAVMQYATTGPYALKSDPEIWADFRSVLQQSGYQKPLNTIERFAFYEAAGTPDVALTIATGEQRIYANLLLTIGVVVSLRCNRLHRADDRKTKHEEASHATRRLVLRFP